MFIKWFGHSSFELKIGNKVLYIDPYAGEHEEYVDKADIILVSHWHYDHCCLVVMKQITVDDTKIVSTKETAAQFGGARVINPGETVDFGGIMVTATPAYNIRRGGEHEKGAGLGFLIHAEDKTIYFMGDTEQIPEMKGITADIVLAPVGGTYVMDAEEAARAVEQINPKLAIPTHYGKIGSITDAEYFRDLLEAKGIHVILLDKGKEKEL